MEAIMHKTKQLLIIIFTAVIGITLISCRTQATSLKQNTVLVYFADKEMLKLVPEEIDVSGNNKDKIAEKIIQELEKGRDSNDKIVRVIPKVKNGIKVKTENETAIVDFSDKFVQAHSGGSINEILTIYSIVNSLISIDGITKVKFTINGKPSTEFKGHIDFTETFVFDPSI